MNDYGDNWPEIRRKILERDEFTCSICHSTGDALVVHHDRPLSMGGTNDESNLWTLCRRCHAHVHTQINTMTKEYGSDGIEFWLDEKKYAEYMRSCDVD